MTINNVISGITLNGDIENGVYICYIVNFSDEIKIKIREMLKYWIFADEILQKIKNG